jgi:hypothetical protein
MRISRVVRRLLNLPDVSTLLKAGSVGHRDS